MSEQEFEATALRQAQEHQRTMLAGMSIGNSESDLIRRMWYKLQALETEVSALRIIVETNNG